jgi:hypothetical protein
MQRLILIMISKSDDPCPIKGLTLRLLDSKDKDEIYVTKQ